MASDANGRLVVPAWSDDGIVKALVNDDGRIEVTIGEATATLDVNLKSSDITLDVEEQSPLTSIQAQLYAWINSAWHKQPILRGYSGVARSYLSKVSTGAGATYAETGACPADYIRVMEGFTVRHNQATVRHLWAGVNTGAVYCNFRAYQNCAQNLFYGEGVSITCEEGEKFFVGGVAAGAGETFSGYYVCRQIYIGG